MRKLALAMLACGGLIVSAESASAGWYDRFGYYHCVWGLGYYGYNCY
jgi:hypothetical protein